jgi:hypothetical protein
MAHSASAAAAAASRARLAPFVHLAQTASGAAAAQLCSDAAAAPGVYAFAELLAVPGIRQVSARAAVELSRWGARCSAADEPSCMQRRGGA